MANRIAGVCYLKVDGAQYALRGALTVSPDSFEREGVAGMDGVHGYIERPRVPFITADLTDTAGLSLEALQAVTDATITVELANGKTYLLRNAWTAEARELNAADGQVSVRFEGKKGEEVMA
jgi:hypothetical protein